MAVEAPFYEQMLEEEYIEMDVSSSRFVCYNIDSTLSSRDFEFHLPISREENEPTPSPADELFYKGKLLPLHLPPRMQMIERLLDSSSPIATAVRALEEPRTKGADKEWNLEKYSTCARENVRVMPKKSWAKKLKLIKQSTLSLKLKASRAYIKSLFVKSSCPDESSVVFESKENSKKTNRTEVRRDEHFFDEIATKDARKSIATSIGTFNPMLTNSLHSSSSSCSSSSSSSSSFSRGSSSQPMLKRSSSVKSEVESSIQGAITHCKNSLQKVSARKSLSDVGRCSLSVAQVVAACNSDDWACLRRR